MLVALFCLSSMKNYVVMDIDGCCLDNRDRLPLLDQKDGHLAYHAAYALDIPIPAGVAVYSSLMKAGHIPVFLTSRHEKNRDYTMEQLTHLFGDLLEKSNAVLLMRQEVDFELDPVFKLKALTRQGVHPDEVLVAFDDRPSVVEAYRKVGIVAYQTAEGW